MFGTTTLSDLYASIVTISAPTFESLIPYLVIAIAVPLAFWGAKKAIGMIPGRR